MNLEQTKKYLEELKEEFALVESHEDRLEMMVDLGKNLDELPVDQRTPENKVPGCVSEVFVAVEKDQEGKVTIKSCSQSHIVKGFLVILLKSLNGLSTQEVVDAEPLITDFITQTGMEKSMVASRANAFGNVFQTIKEKAQAL